jgi:hypothetical protein
MTAIGSILICEVCDMDLNSGDHTCADYSYSNYQLKQGSSKDDWLVELRRHLVWVIESIISNATVKLKHYGKSDPR